MKTDDRTGIRRHGAGWQARVSFGYGRELARHFPLDTPLHLIQAWRQDERAKHRLTRKQRAAYGTFEGDAKRYLKAVKALPTISDRTREIHLWITVFGTRQRDSITATDIRQQRDAWLTEPRSKTDKRPVKPGTVNKRLRALSNLYAVLDGPRAPNPVRDVPECPEPRPSPRAISYPLLMQLLDAMPDIGQTTKRGKTRPRASKTKIRLRVMAYTGWPPGVLKRLTADDVDLELGIARLPPRHKGAGADGIVVPLLPQAIDALRDMTEHHCWGSFHRKSMWALLKRAAKKIKAPWLRPYDLRHLYGTALAAASGDEGATQHVLQHADVRTTRRYILGSVPPRVLAAVRKLSKELQRTPEDTQS